MKRFISVLLVLSFALSVSASAASVYEIESDTAVLTADKNYSISPFGYGTVISGLSDNQYLQLIADDTSAIWKDMRSGFTSVLDFLDGIYSDTTSIWNRLGIVIDNMNANLTNMLTVFNSNHSSMINCLEDVVLELQGIYDFFDSSGFATESTLSSLLSYLSGGANWSILDAYGGISAVPYSPYPISSILNNGLIGLSSYFTARSGWTILGASGTPVANTNDRYPLSGLLNNAFLSINRNMTARSGWSMVSSDGQFKVNSVDYYPLTGLLNDAFLGLNSNLLIGENLPFLSETGTITLPYAVDFGTIIRHGFLGVKSLVSGSETDNVYSGTIVSNDNVETSFNATGLGPMLNKYMGAIQHDTGLLTYIFASPQDLDAKKRSESNTQAVADSFLDAKSDASVSLDDIGALSSASKSVQSLGQTGVTPNQAFEQLGDASLFDFFSQETASNLDTTVMTLSYDPAQQIVTNYYEQSRLDFFNLIGEEGSE